MKQWQSCAHRSMPRAGSVGLAKSPVPHNHVNGLSGSRTGRQGLAEAGRTDRLPVHRLGSTRLHPVVRQKCTCSVMFTPGIGRVLLSRSVRSARSNGQMQESKCRAVGGRRCPRLAAIQRLHGQRSFPDTRLPGPGDRLLLCANGQSGGCKCALKDCLSEPVWTSSGRILPDDGSDNGVGVGVRRPWYLVGDSQSSVSGTVDDPSGTRLPAYQNRRTLGG